MKNDLGLSKGLLNSVSSLLNTSSKQKQEEAKADHERLAAHVKPGSMRPLSMEEAKVASYAAKAPERRVSDTITQLYTQSVADHNAKAQAEAAVIKTAYGKMGGVQPVMVSEEVVIDEGLHVMPRNNDKADSRHSAVMAHAKKMGYNVHHEEHYGDEKSGNKGSPDITIHYQRGDDRKSASPEAIEIHKSGKAAGDKVLKLHAMGKNVSDMTSEAKELSPKQKKLAAVAGNKKEIDAMDLHVLRSRKTAQATSVSDEKILDGESIDELNKETLGSYVAKATDSAADNAISLGYKAGRRQGGSEHVDKLAKRIAGIKKAAGKMVQEEEEVIDEMSSKMKMKLGFYGKKKKNNEESVEENKDTPGNSAHQCAIHVKHATMGEGRTLTSQHAQPDTEGEISWYTVMFEHGIEKVDTKDLEVLVSESHMNHKPMKKKKM